MIRDVHQEHIDRLCPELAQLLATELAAGNKIVQTGCGLVKPDGVVVGLGKPFRAAPAVLPLGVVYREVNDPHWWKAELVHEPSGDLIFCRG